MDSTVYGSYTIPEVIYYHVKLGRDNLKACTINF